MMKCPILNHALKDGVLVERASIIQFLQMRVVDFRPQELVCRKCLDEVVEIYERKKKSAIQKKKSGSSIATVTSSTSSSNQSQEIVDSFDRIITKTPRHEKIRKEKLTISAGTTTSSSSSSAVETSLNRSQDVMNLAESSESRVNTTPATNSLSRQPSIRSSTVSPSTLSAITVRKRTITDFYNRQVPQARTVSNSSDYRRDSELPTTSAAAAASAARNKRPHSQAIDLSEVDSEDDEPRRSLHYYGGTPLPNIQPMPPIRREPSSLPDQSVMDKYIRNLTGG